MRPSRSSSRRRRRRDRRGVGADRRGDARPRAGGRVVTIANGCDFEDFPGLEYHRGDAVPHHAHGQLLRQARPAAVPDRARESGLDCRRALRRGLPRRRPRVGRIARARRPARAAPVRAPPRSLELQRDSDALLLLIPEAGRPRPRRALGEGLRVPRRRAADPGARPAGRRRRRPDPGDRCGRSSSRRTTSTASRPRSRDLHGRWRRRARRDRPLAPSARPSVPADAGAGARGAAPTTREP